MVTKPLPVPVTTPAEPTVAIMILLLLHVPPDGLPDNGTVAPTQTEVPPETTGEAFTVIVL
jgi:hypothetical protein